MKELVLVSARIDKQVRDQLHQYAKQEGRTFQWVMENAIKDFVNKDKTVLEMACRSVLEMQKEKRDEMNELF